jgi:hypothetical protein
MLRSHPVMSTPLQRDHWNRQSTCLGDRFRVSKMGGDKPLGVVCRLWTHQRGCEVRLEIDSDLRRSQVFRVQDDVLPAGETSKAAMIEKGWR